MATKNPRINVTFDADMAQALSSLADQEKKSVSSLVRELAMQALAFREDKKLSQLADDRDQTLDKVYTHDQAWS